MRTPRRLVPPSEPQSTPGGWQMGPEYMGPEAKGPLSQKREDAKVILRLFNSHIGSLKNPEKPQKIIERPPEITQNPPRPPAPCTRAPSASPWVVRNIDGQTTAVPRAFSIGLYSSVYFA